MSCFLSMSIHSNDSNQVSRLDLLCIDIQEVGNAKAAFVRWHVMLRWINSMSDPVHYLCVELAAQ